MKTSAKFSPSSEQGSLLIVAMILSAVIALSLGSYLTLCRSTLVLSNRSLYNNASMNLAEEGLEESMYSINQMVADNPAAWDDWSISGPNAYRKWTGKVLGQNATGEIRAFVFNYKGISPPKLIARAITSLGSSNSRPIEKWIEVDLVKTSKFSNGLVAKTSILFNGQPMVDSWNSVVAKDGTARATPVGFSGPERTDNGSVGSISVALGAVAVKNADVWGYVATGKDDVTDDVKNNGSILGADSVPDASWKQANVDPSRISTNFSASFDPVYAPTQTPVSLGAITSSTSLPRKNGSGVIIDTADVTTGKYYYTSTSLSLKSSEYLNITDGKVVVTFTDATKSVTLAGQSKVGIASGASLEMYAAGDVDMTGGGIANGSITGSAVTDVTANQPINFQVYGTKTTGTQNFKIAGNGTFSGIVYAPQGSVTLTGTTETMGSIVANDITVNGDSNFHYDESLADMGGNNPYRVGVWKELTDASARSAYAAQMEF